MRRLLLRGGLGLALGVAAGPASAQDRAPRAALLGRPVASAPAPGPVTPAAGVVARGQIAPSVGPGIVTPAAAPTPLAVQLPNLVGPPPGGVRPLPLSTPRTGTPGPTISLVDDPRAAAAGAPTPIAVPDGAVYPSPMDGGLVGGGVPAVGPSLGDACPTPDAPLYGGRPGLGALSRLLGIGGGPDRHWASAEYLLWWTKSTQLPVLAATGPIPGADGVVTTPVPILSGSFGETLHGGGRFSGGWWFDDCQTRGVDGRIFFLGRNGSSFTTNSTAFPVLGRPFLNNNPADIGGMTAPVGPLTDVIGAPGRFAGGLSVQLENTLWGAEANFRRRLAGTACSRLDGLVGYRYLNFKETLTITEAGVILDPTLIDAGRAPIASATDQFRTTNDFHGGQVGLTGEVRRGRWFVDGRASVAFGTVFQRAEISGSQLQAFPDGRVAQVQGGLLALPGANMGTFGRDRFAVLPEVGVNLGYHVTGHCRVFVGYNFLYLSSVLRPASVIDPVVDAARVPNFLPGNPTPLPGTPRPAPQLNGTDFFAQGVNFGVQWTW